jgi:hypothetical protein
MSSAEAERLVREGRARWFRTAGDAQDFATRLGGRYVGEIDRPPTWIGRISFPTTARHLAVVGPVA